MKHITILVYCLSSTASSSATITAPQPAHLTVDTQFHQEQQALSTPSSVASGNSSTPNSSAGGVNNNSSSPVSRSTPPLSSHGLTNSSLVNDSSTLLHQHQQGPNISLRPASTSNTAAMLGQQHHSLNMIMNANAFHAPNAFSSAAILQPSAGLSKFSSTDQLGGFSSSSNDGIVEQPSGSVLSPSSNVSSIISTGVSSMWYSVMV